MRKKETVYMWKELGEGDVVYLTPWADPQLYEYPFDFMFDTIEDAKQGLLDWGGDTDWVLCKVTTEPVHSV